MPARVLASLDDATTALIAERDENTCRKAMTASEVYAMGQELEALERPKAKERKQATQHHGNEKAGGAQCTPPGTGKTRDKVGEALGMSGVRGRNDHAPGRVTSGCVDQKSTQAPGGPRSARPGPHPPRFDLLHLLQAAVRVWPGWGAVKAVYAVKGSAGYCADLRSGGASKASKASKGVPRDPGRPPPQNTHNTQNSGCQSDGGTVGLVTTVRPVTNTDGHNRDDPLGFVVAKNLNRRHLTDSQRATVAAELANIAQGLNKKYVAEDPHACGSSPVTQQEAADLMDVGIRVVQQAKQVQPGPVPLCESA